MHRGRKSVSPYSHDILVMTCCWDAQWGWILPIIPFSQSWSQRLWPYLVTWERQHYPMIKTQSMQKRVCGNVWFPYGCLDVSYMSWDKSKKPCPCGNNTFPNEVHHQNLESTQLAALYFPRPDDAPHQEMSNFCMGMGSCYNIEARQGACNRCTYEAANSLITIIFTRFLICVSVRDLITIALTFRCRHKLKWTWKYTGTGVILPLYVIYHEY